MATVSGTTSWDLAIDEILEEAASRVGNGVLTGRDSVEARRSLNLLLIDMANRGVPLAAMEEKTLSLTAGTSEYTLPSDVTAVLYGVLNRDSKDILMNRISLYDFKKIPVKSQQGRPTQYSSHRDRDAVNLKLWPTPENSTDTFKYWAFVKIDDVTKQDQLVDLPTRYLPAIVSGLAFFLALKKVPDKLDIINNLKNLYEETLRYALEEDRERTSFFAVPSLPRI